MEVAEEDAVKPIMRLLQPSQQDMMIIWTWEMAEQMQKTGWISEVFFPTFSFQDQSLSVPLGKQSQLDWEMLKILPPFEIIPSMLLK